MIFTNTEYRINNSFLFNFAKVAADTRNVKLVYTGSKMALV
jgi:hypothetical protein